MMNMQLGVVRDSVQYFKSAVLMESVQEALLGSKLHNA